MREVTIIIPHLPPSVLMPNRLRRLHWAVRAKVEKAARWEGRVSALDMMIPPFEAFNKAVVSYQFTVKSKRKGILNPC